MQEEKIKDITPESVLEEMKERGEIDEEIYKEIKFRFEDIEDIHKLNYYQIYDKAYKNNRVQKCIEVLLDIAKYEPSTLKRGMLLSNCLKNPMGMKYNEQEYRKVMYILTEAMDAAKEQGYGDKIIKVLRELALYTHSCCAPLSLTFN